MAPNAYHVFRLSASLLASIFHLFGIILLCLINTEGSNQILLIANLAGTELLYSLDTSVYWIIKMIDGGGSEALVTANWILALSLLMANKLMMFHLILDRFADIYLHLRYPMIFTKTRVIKILCGLWAFSLVYGTITATLAIWIDGFKDPEKEESEIIQSFNYFTLVIDATITIVALMTYLYFYSKVSSIVKKANREEKQRNQGTDRIHKRKFLVPFLMIATYLVFNVSSTIMFTIRRQYSSLSEGTMTILNDVGWSSVTVGYISDAVLYIFLQRSVRISIASYLRKICICRKYRLPTKGTVAPHCHQNAT